jgi:hypothetical protein
MFYRGTTYFSSLEILQNRAFDLQRISQNQTLWPNPGGRTGVFLTTQASTGIEFARQAGPFGRGGGPGLIRVDVNKLEFKAFAAKNGISFETSFP